MAPRIPLALALLFLGMVTLLKGVSPMPENLFDVGLISLGLALILSYVAVLGETFEDWMESSPFLAFAPVLSSMGLAVIVEALTAPYTWGTQLTLLAVGSILVVLPPLLSWRR